MPTVPGDDRGRRIPFDRGVIPQVHHQDRDKDHPAPELEGDSALQDFIWEHSNLNALRHCSRRFPCSRRFCPWCSRRVAASTRRALWPVALTFDRVTVWTATTASRATYAEARDDFDKLMKMFSRGGWLTARTEAWHREIEITHSDTGWHVHAHSLLFLETTSADDYARLSTEIIRRWLSLASLMQISAHPAGQHVRQHGNVREQVCYVTKGLMGTSSTKTPQNGSGGRTPADLLALARSGDADALDLWRELEADRRRRRWMASGGAFRQRTADRP